jgi:hypothetical protein
MINVIKLNGQKTLRETVKKLQIHKKIRSHRLSVGAQSTEAMYMTENGKQLYIRIEGTV